MQAKTTKAFRGRRDNEGFMTEFAPGDLLEGDLASSAVKQRIAVRYDPEAEACRAAAEAAAAEKLIENAASGDAASDETTADKADVEKTATGKTAADKATADKAGK